MKVRIALLLALAAPAVFAGPADYIYLPTVEYGEKEIDFKFGTSKAAADYTFRMQVEYEF